MTMIDHKMKVSEFIYSRLEKITGYRIVVDKIQTHENIQGKPEVDK